MSQPIAFYFGSGSPYAWKVWLALEHKKLPYVAERMTFDGGELKLPAFTAINPRGQVPALVDNGFAMYESAAILEYLEDRYPDSGAPLWPRDVQARAIARRRAAEVSSHIDPLNNVIFDLVFGSASTNANTNTNANVEALADWKKSMRAELGRIEAWMDKDYLAGSQLSGADFTLYPYVAFLGRIDARKPGNNLLALVPPKLTAWMKRIEALPYFMKTYPPHWQG